MPAVVVLLPHFDCETYLASSVRSILNQTMNDYELWIIDDHSTTDNWLTALAEIQKQARVRLWRTDRNVGPYRIKSRMIEKCDCEYIAFQDADDMSHHRRLEVQTRSMSARGIHMVGTSFNYIDVNNRVIKAHRMPRFVRFAQRLGKRFLLHHPTSVVKRSVFEKIGAFDGSTHYAADADFVLRCLWKFKVRNLKNILYDYRVRPSSLTQSMETGFHSLARQKYLANMHRRELQRRAAGKVDFQELQPVGVDTEFSVSEI